jgi:antitoxin component YwqK of YwqJK toxin-antitoxin module
VPIYFHAQKGAENYINKYDLNDEKTGLWIELDDKFRKEIYYLHGVKDGMYKEYNGYGTLFVLGEYKDNEMIGTWYYFGSKGHLMRKETNFSKVKIRPMKYKYLCTTFHLNGHMASQGYIISDKSSDDELWDSVGTWNFFDESGKLIKTEIYYDP